MTDFNEFITEGRTTKSLLKRNGTTEGWITYMRGFVVHTHHTVLG
jgi:hypothetical protein